jgi:hypothetical protein
MFFLGMDFEREMMELLKKENYDFWDMNINLNLRMLEHLLELIFNDLPKGTSKIFFVFVHLEGGLSTYLPKILNSIESFIFK